MNNCPLRFFAIFADNNEKFILEFHIIIFFAANFEEGFLLFLIYKNKK
jgi:hypothetical protein